MNVTIFLKMNHLPFQVIGGYGMLFVGGIRMMNTKETIREDEEKRRLITRLRRIEGQVRGIQKMVDEDRYCIDILIQINAINAALKQVGFSLLERHTAHCVLHALESGEGDTAVKELIDVVKQFAK